MFSRMCRVGAHPLHPSRPLLLLLSRLRGTNSTLQHGESHIERVLYNTEQILNKMPRVNKEKATAPCRRLGQGRRSSQVSCRFRRAILD